MSPRRSLDGIRPVLAAARRPLRLARRHLVVALAALTGFAAVKVLLPWPVKILFDTILPQSGDSSRSSAFLPSEPRLALLTLCGAVAVLYLMKGWFFRHQAIETSRAGKLLITGIRGALLAKVLTLPASGAGQRRTGDLLARVLSDVNQIRDLLLGTGLDVIGEALTFVAMLVILLTLDPWLALGGVLLLPLLVLPTLRTSGALREAAREQRHREGKLSSSLTEVLRSLRVVQAFGREASHLESFGARDAKAMNSEVRLKRLQVRLVQLLDIGVACGTVVVIWFGGQRVLAGELSAGSLFIFMSYLKSMYRPLEDLARLSARFNKAWVSGERISDILGTPESVADPPRPAPLERAAGELEFDRVTFGYRSDAPVLRDVSLRIRPGECVALIGPSGAGKTTLTQLLLRFHDPESGSIRLDGRDLRDYRRADVRAQIAAVFQEPYLFGVSVRENLVYGRADADEAAIRNAAREARADEFIDALPEGYDTILGEHGASLSGGQRQRLSIARALLRDAPILILDEPMTGLDEAREREVHEALRRLKQGRTTLLITHRMDALEGVDRVFVLEPGGVLRESGAGFGMETKRGRNPKDPTPPLNLLDVAP